MSFLGLEMWIGFVLAAIVLGVGAYFMARRDDSIDFDTERRDDQRRVTERRRAKERRGLSRLLHDRLHNPGRRRSERREGERRRSGEWQREIEQLRARVEAVKQTERDRKTR